MYYRQLLVKLGHMPCRQLAKLCLTLAQALIVFLSNFNVTECALVSIPNDYICGSLGDDIGDAFFLFA